MIVADTGPLLAAAFSGDEAHALAAALVMAAGRDLLVPDPVAVEADWLIRSRMGHRAAQLFLTALADGDPVRAALSGSQFARAVAIDRHYADLGLGLVDASVMAVAETEESPVLTFDFAHFRAAPPTRGGTWPLVIDERLYRQEVGRR